MERNYLNGYILLFLRSQSLKSFPRSNTFPLSGKYGGNGFTAPLHPTDTEYFVSNLGTLGRDDVDADAESIEPLEDCALRMFWGTIGVTTMNTWLKWERNELRSTVSSGPDASLKITTTTSLPIWRFRSKRWGSFSLYGSIVDTWYIISIFLS